MPVIILMLIPGPGLGDSAGRQALPDKFTIVDLGTLGGWTATAHDINERGQVVGAADTPSGYRHAYLWEDGVMTDLGTLGVPNASSDAWSINNLGQIVGSLGGGGGLGAAFFWEDGEMEELGDPVIPKSAYGINDAGQVVGIMPAAGGNHAFLYEAGVMTDLGTLGGSTSIAWEINASGQIAGASFTGAGEHAVLWEDGTPVDLGTLGPGGSEAYGINDAGQVVGWSQYEAGVKSYTPFVWEAGEMTDIGAIVGWRNIRADGLNNLGHVVAGFFLFDATTEEWVNLRETIPADSGWTTIVAEAINDSDQIAGWGYHDGVARAFLMTPVPPQVPTLSPWGTLVLALVFAATIAIVARRHA